MSRPDAPSPSAFRALADVNYNEDAWERDVDGWTIAFSLKRSEDDIREKQIRLFDTDDNNVCRETFIFGGIQSADDVEDFNLITISKHDTLYGFCLFEGYMTITVKTMCSAENSFRGTGRFLLALLTKYAHACTVYPVYELIISEPLPKAKPFYEKLGFKKGDDPDEMKMSLNKKSDGVHFAPMEEMRGTKRPRSESLVLLVV